MLIDVLLRPGFLRPVFQPIVRVIDGDAVVLHGLECLMRGEASGHFESAEVMFEYVRRKGAEPRMDEACILAALAAAREFPTTTRLSLNVHAATLVRTPQFARFLERTLAAAEILPSRITLEVTEHSVPWVTGAFFEALEDVRQSGMSIALDDVGIGHSNFKMMLDVQPDVFKVDRYFIRGIADDPYKQSIVDALVRVGKRVGADVVAEGVGDASDLAMVLNLGIELMQGFVFARPAPASELMTHALLQAAANT